MKEIVVLLVASVTLQGVTGVVTAPDFAPPASVSSLVAASESDPATGIFQSRAPVRAGHHARVDASLLPQLTGTALLAQLPLLKASELESFIASHPDAVSQLLLDPPPAVRTEEWWRSLSLATQYRLKAGAAAIIGSLPGVPFAMRDAANRALLTQTIGALEERADSGVGRGEGTEIAARLSMLHEVEVAITERPGEPRRWLINLDTEGSGRAAVAIGDLLAADYVSYLIPGMFFTVEGQVVDWTQTAIDLLVEQRGWIDLLGLTDPGLADKKVATVAWMGYQTPSLFTVGSEDLADDGALYLDSAMDSLYNERRGNRPFVSLLAHSYGSTAAMKALATGSFEVDSFAMVGSPGSAAKSVDELHVRGRNVFVGEASWDPVVGTGFFGNDPGAPAYGAQRMSVAGGLDLITEDELTASVGHNEYFAPRSESLRNMALIGINRGSLVSDGSGLDVQRTLAYFDRLI